MKKQLRYILTIIMSLLVLGATYYMLTLDMPANAVQTLPTADTTTLLQDAIGMIQDSLERIRPVLP
ncbi:hypothetical protein [Pontibacter sp. G13]|uniref:hypothetical protein n=1 Tax=Pontibacter sp. G13 TaxID=3074898 RepID=UPI00288A5512|nr:hypothetical protein [Pontibacter sp. G13]WNJ20236.1 hypothetical protein RJD25_07130 [Pontibacter sp. G13]